MSEAVSQHLSSSERVKISFIDRKNGKIRLVHKNNENNEYTLPLGSDERFRPGDFVDATILGGRLQALAYPPGAEPEEPKKVQTPPKESSAPVSINSKPKSCKLIKREGDSRVLILKLDGTEEWFPLTEEGKRNLPRLRDGQNVIVGFENISGKYHLKKILPATPAGEYDKEGWVKGTGGKGGGFSRSDPVIDLIRNFSILHEAALDKAEKWAEFAFFNKLTPEQREEGWNWIKKTSITTSIEIYSEIEKKHKYQGGMN